MNKLRDYWVICGFMIMFGTITECMCIGTASFIPGQSKSRGSIEWRGFMCGGEHICH